MILADVSLKRPVFATVTILALVLLGLVSSVSLSIDEWPDVEFPYVSVVVGYKGAAPEQVDSKIVQKVEEAVSSAAGVKHIYSSSREGVATTTVEFTLETIPNVAAQDVRDKIGRIRGELPEGIDEPVIMRFDPAETPVMSVVLTGDLSVREMTRLVEEVIKRRLEGINGVGAINVQGAAEREIHIELQRDKLAAYGLTVSEVADGLRNDNLEIPGGKLTQGEREVTLRTQGSLERAAEFLEVSVGRRGGLPLYVRHLGEVRDGTEEPESVTTLDGKPAIGLDIMKQSGVNTVKVAGEIDRAVAKLQGELPPGAKLVIVRDNSRDIRESVQDVLFNLVAGGILAVAIVFLFLGNWRSTVISAIAIPASIITTFFAMKVMAFTLNTMSLMALSLAVGILIDDAIVVIENIVRHMEMGKGKLEAAREGTEEIGLAVTATTLTLVAVFVPVGMMTGIVGQFFKQFGLTVAFAVLVSLLIAFTLTPLLSASFLDVAHGQKANWLGRGIAAFNRWFDQLTIQYGRLLEYGLRRRGKVVALSLTLFVASLGLIPLLGAGFITRGDNGQFVIWADLDAGVSVDGAARTARGLEEIVRQLPETKLVYTVAGADKITTFVQIGGKSERTRSSEAIQGELREKLKGLPGIRASIVQKAGLKEGKPVELVVRGESTAVLEDLAELAQRAMEATPGAVDVASTYKPGKPDIQLQVRRDRAADLGVSAAGLADTVRTLFNGIVVGQLKDGDDRFDVRLRLRPEDRQGVRDLQGVFVPSKKKDVNEQAVMIPLGQVTEWVYSTTASEIRRYDRQKEIRLSANLEGQSLGQFNKELKKNLGVIPLPQGYEFLTIGESERMGETFTSMVLALLLAVSFIFFILAAQFESYVDPLSIMLSLPLAAIGAILGLLLMRSELSIMSMIGIIMLMGLVTKNAILLIDFAKRRMEEGVPCAAALVEAAQVRLRPIMMTTAAMIFGMLPLALGIGPGAESRAPMAHAIIGGLVTSTLLTLVVVPVMYSLLQDAKKHLQGEGRRQAGKSTARDE